MKRIRFAFWSERTKKGWALDVTDKETLQSFARQDGFTTQQDAHLAGELLLDTLVAIGGDLKERGEWEEVPRD